MLISQWLSVCIAIYDSVFFFMQMSQYVVHKLCYDVYTVSLAYCDTYYILRMQMSLWVVHVCYIQCILGNGFLYVLLYTVSFAYCNYTYYIILVCSTYANEPVGTCKANIKRWFLVRFT